MKCIWNYLEFLFGSSITNLWTSLLSYFDNSTSATVTFQTVQTLIRGLLQEPSDLGLHCLKTSSVYYTQVYSLGRVSVDQSKQRRYLLLTSDTEYFFQASTKFAVIHYLQNAMINYRTGFKLYISFFIIKESLPKLLS